MDLNYSEYIKSKRQQLGLNQREFAELLGLNESGERTVSGWERGEHKPSPSRWENIVSLSPAYLLDRMAKILGSNLLIYLLGLEVSDSLFKR